MYILYMIYVYIYIYICIYDYILHFIRFGLLDLRKETSSVPPPHPSLLSTPLCIFPQPTFQHRCFQTPLFIAFCCCHPQISVQHRFCQPPASTSSSCYILQLSLRQDFSRHAPLDRRAAISCG